MPAAELTTLESKLGEVMGLAMASQKLTKKVSGMLDEGTLQKRVEKMGAEAAELERRCEKIAGDLNGKKAAIKSKARETREKADGMMKSYLKGEKDPLDGFEFLQMAEAGEVGHWKIVQLMAQKAGNQPVQKLADWALPVQERHMSIAFDCGLALAKKENPNAPA